jgi:hypothetical protein
LDDPVTGNILVKFQGSTMRGEARKPSILAIFEHFSARPNQGEDGWLRQGHHWIARKIWRRTVYISPQTMQGLSRYNMLDLEGPGKSDSSIIS